MKNRNILFAALLSVLASFALLPKAQAVSPAPDGGYAGGNTAEGQNALLSLTTGTFNTALGFDSLLSTADTSFNTGVGAGALLSNTGTANTATGAGALLSNTGIHNTANGAFALFSHTSGLGNTAIGYEALFTHMTGDHNTAVGSVALQNLTTGDDNIAVGQNAGNSVTTASNSICIGSDNPNNESNATYIGNINTTIPSGTAVVVNSNNRLATLTSSRRFKDEIKPMGKASEVLFALKPVTFRYKKEIDPQGIPQFGLVAEEVEKANPDLVVRDKQGKPYSVRYEQVNAMLLNEFLKEHKKVEEQQSTIDSQQASIAELKSTIARQQKEMEVLTAQLKEQAAQIQRVSAQLQVSKPVTKVVVNKP
jgi:uncharacterized coiled-coil protein SlyX